MHIQHNLIFLAICTAITIFLQIFSSYFIYFVPELPQQFWRFWTGHWVHVSWIHWLFNWIAFACIPFIFFRHQIREFSSMLLIFPIMISLMFYAFFGDVVAYAGLSGVLHAMYVALALLSLQHLKDRWFALMVLLIVMAKVIWEQLYGDVGTAAMIGSEVLVDAHLVGVWCGVSYALCDLIYKKIKS